MTWPNHTIANGAVAFALTGHPVAGAAAMFTALVPDQLEAGLPFVRHRGCSHWMALWGLVSLAGALLPAQPLVDLLGDAAALLGVVGLGGPTGFHHPHLLSWAHQATLGLSLGPLLHCLVDGCSIAGVPWGPGFGSHRFRLGLYKTRQTRRWWSLGLSEGFFLATLLAGCWFYWRWRAGNPGGWF